MTNMTKKLEIPAATEVGERCKLGGLPEEESDARTLAGSLERLLQGPQGDGQILRALCRPQGWRPPPVQLPRRLALCRRKADPASGLGDRTQGPRQRRHRPRSNQLRGHPWLHRSRQEGQGALRGAQGPGTSAAAGLSARSRWRDDRTQLLERSRSAG